jgi:Tfp pilus assembly PilM family ATPase
LDTEASPLDDVYAFESAVQNWLEYCQIESVEAVSVSIPAFRSIVRQVFVPPEAAKNMDDYIKWYVSLITNAEANAYIIDYQILSGEESLGFTVMLIAVREKWVDNLRKGFRSKMLAPKAMDVDVLSIMNLVDFAENVTELTCVVKADYAGVTLLWLTKDNLQALRCVSTLSLVNKTPEEAYQFLVSGIAEQIRVAQEENASIVTKQIKLCGDMANDMMFVGGLRQKLSDCQVIPMDSFSNLRLPIEAEDSAAVLSCAGAIGAALNVMEGV